jgi:hypothetical protein
MPKPISVAAHILVSEIVTNDLLGEDVLPAHERRCACFSNPAGMSSPHGIIRTALAEELRDDHERLTA